MMKKKRLLTRYDLSINYFHEPIIKTVDISKDKIFERDKDYCKDLCEKKLRKQLEDNVNTQIKATINRDISQIN